MGLTITNIPKHAEPEAVATAIEALAARFGNRLVTSQAVREQHGHTTTWLPTQPPDAVVMAQETADIQDVVRICAKNNVPVIAFGTGTSLEGQVNAPAGGICIDLRDMNKILEVHAEDLDCVIQPGVTRKALNENLRDQGVFFPIDPGADASIGGMASTRASGTNAVRYGTMRDNVLALKVVRGDGEIITTGTRAKKSSAGYDLTHLFVGAEGTLGIISELTIKLRGIPETIAAAACSFESVQGACQATILAIQTGIPVARIELLSEGQVRAVNAYSKLTLPETPLLLLEFHGSEIEVAEQSKNFRDIAADCGGGDFTWTTRPEDRSKLWQARHDAYWSVKALRPGAGVVATDVCVPISRLADCVVETEQDLKRLNLLAPIVGHVGDGNFHCSLLCDVNDADEMARGEEFMHRLVERAQAMDGTCTGEHGIGQGKQKYLAAELGLEALAAMRAIKQALDPQNIFNPGKILPQA
ncbi:MULTISPECIES: FAD-linked oxidase C-terminal domain-containing protein [Rhodopseudomonas]|uniref:D-lactate dehydrogenase (cytochrome) n=1 Tax=Rhodopseudomonas palustris TaxID=1076 RepID=A0A0D7F307_RHOPL|nr:MULTISPECIES: FAD-linked oxidase C-terminal domain-containing protein [Rhodopseudomonas]KIZ47434.1 lactate dehydrogenase [Rhodopseudomonas palustris]MDF3808948.1 FAD-linked oxidase C-terminal domain-containing protein [Rhodopseudomonas sp. BAL398]WOK18343.1 FAD-linked oxidase C-terminal domain-containing protein [Rhodopseudomonas sp. BAL398]